MAKENVLKRTIGKLPFNLDWKEVVADIKKKKA